MNKENLKCGPLGSRSGEVGHRDGRVERNPHANNTSTKSGAKEFRKAARLVAESSEYAACRAIASAICGKFGWIGLSDAPHGELVAKFRAFFSPEVGNNPLYWWPHDAEGNECRVIALCLMAAMVEAGDA